MYRGCGDRNSDVSPLEPSSILSPSRSFSLLRSPSHVVPLYRLPFPSIFLTQVFLLVARAPPSISFLVPRSIFPDGCFTLPVSLSRRAGCLSPLARFYPLSVCASPSFAGFQPHSRKHFHPPAAPARVK